MINFTSKTFIYILMGEMVQNKLWQVYKSNTVEAKVFFHKNSEQ